LYNGEAANAAVHPAPIGNETNSESTFPIRQAGIAVRAASARIEAISAGKGVGGAP
jgi:hypothetical protein